MATLEAKRKRMCQVSGQGQQPVLPVRSDLVASPLQFLVLNKIWYGTKFDLEKFSQHVAEMMADQAQHRRAEKDVGSSATQIERRGIYQKSTDDRYQDEAYVNQLKDEPERKFGVATFSKRRQRPGSTTRNCTKNGSRDKRMTTRNFVKQMEKIITFKASIFLTKTCPPASKQKQMMCERKDGDAVCP